MAIIHYEELSSRKIIKDKFRDKVQKLKPYLYHLKEEDLDKKEIIEFCKNEKLAVLFNKEKHWNNFMNEEPIYKLTVNMSPNNTLI